MTLKGKIMIGACGVIAVAGIAFSVYLVCKYGNTPLQDLPTWLWWLLK